VPDNHQLLAATIPSAKPLAGITILLVEDETFIAELLIDWLGRLGAKTLWANNGKEGIQLFNEASGRVGVVIADFRLPDITGADVCIQLRELQPKLPVLISSGRYQREAHEALALGGPTCFIQKPYPLDELLVKLQKLLASP
jgi:DNA-binding response OmpR family regulator